MIRPPISAKTGLAHLSAIESGPRSSSLPVVGEHVPSAASTTPQLTISVPRAAGGKTVQTFLKTLSLNVERRNIHVRACDRSVRPSSRPTQRPSQRIAPAGFRLRFHMGSSRFAQGQVQRSARPPAWAWRKAGLPYIRAAWTGHKTSPTIARCSRFGQCRSSRRTHVRSEKSEAIGCTSAVNGAIPPAKGRRVRRCAPRRQWAHCRAQILESSPSSERPP